MTYACEVAVLAYATTIQPFLRDAIVDDDFACHYPGASVWPAVARAVRSRGWEFHTADVVLLGIASGEFSATDVRVIQEEDAPLGAQLIGAGARASLLLCGESPLFARDFYQRLGEVSQGFENALLFRGALRDIAPSTQGHILHFPGFHRGNQALVQPWESRSAVVMVAGNKYWRHEGLPLRQRLQRSWQTFRGRNYVEWLKQHQLHDRRLEYVVGLSEAGLLTLYGPGWESRHHLPVGWQEELGRVGVRGQHLDYSEKPKTLGAFKFSLALENFGYPGYVTEKIIDAIAAGTIPLYLGAPDIADFVPADCFINLRQFESSHELADFVSDINAERGMAMIKRGQEFLSSSAGDVFSYEYQGGYIVDLATA